MNNFLKRNDFKMKTTGWILLKKVSSHKILEEKKYFKTILKWTSLIGSISVLMCSGLFCQTYQPKVLLVQIQSKAPGIQLNSVSTDHHVRPLGFKSEFKINLLSTPEETEWQEWIFNEEIDAPEKAKELMKSGEVIYAEPNYTVETCSAPNDPYFSKQIYFQATDLLALMALPSRQSVKVAVVDTGVYIQHPDLLNHISINTKEIPNNNLDDDNNGIIDDVYGANFVNYASLGKIDNNAQDNNGHGTHLAGIIAAQVNNNIGISGLGIQTKIVPVKFLDEFGHGSYLDGAAAIRYATDMGAAIINCSWGNTQSSKILETAINYAVSKGVIVFAAAGNSATNMIEYPAGCNGVWGVGSVNLANEKSYFSSYGSHVKFSSYGESVYSCLPSGDYGYKSGTSQSTAILSGITAAILGTDSNLNRDAISLILKNSKIAYNAYSTISGISILDSLSLDYKNWKTFSESSIDFSINEVLNFPNPIHQEGTYFGFSISTYPANVSVKIFDIQGRLIKQISQEIYTDGYQRLFWDGKLEDGNFAPNGTYFYLLLAQKGEVKKVVKGKCSILI